MVKHPHVPDRLYKYRKFSPEHLDALKRNVLWISSPNQFNDPNDSAVSFDPDRFFMEDQSIEEFVSSFKDFERTVNAGGNFQFKKLVRPVQQGEWRRKVITELLADIDHQNKEKIINYLDKFINTINADSVKKMSDAIRQGFSVLSLSETQLSNLMWSHYSNSHKGFVIEYDFSKLHYNDLRRRLCFPVFYTKKFRDATRYLAHRDMCEFNNLFGQYMCLMKQSEWEYEREWRIIHAIGPSNANREIEMPMPSAIILGAQVRDVDEYTMRELCKSCKIPLRRIVRPPGSFDLKVQEIVI